jgi:hypothetical protein
MRVRNWLSSLSQGAAPFPFHGARCDSEMSVSRFGRVASAPKRRKASSVTRHGKRDAASLPGTAYCVLLSHIVQVVCWTDRLMARRDPGGIWLLTRRGNDLASRFPLVVEAVNHLKVRSCLIDGEVVCCDERGLANFQMLRHRRREPEAA